MFSSKKRLNALLYYHESYKYTNRGELFIEIVKLNVSIFSLIIIPTSQQLPRTTATATEQGEMCICLFIPCVYYALTRLDQTQAIILSESPFKIVFGGRWIIPS